MEKLSLFGTIVNTLAVIVGTLVGLVTRHFLHGGTGKLGGVMENCSDAVMKGIGLCNVMIGISGAIKTGNALIMILSMIVGGILGTILDLDGKINRFGRFLGIKLSGKGGKSGDFSAGFVNATLLFCIGAMAIVGPMESGLRGIHTIQYEKSLMDGVMAIVLASTLGIGVMLSAAVVFTYQGTLTLIAQWVQPILTETVIAEMAATGSLLILGIGLNLLGITKLKLMNYVPAMFLPILFCLFL